jgi:hypothetical protein
MSWAKIDDRLAQNHKVLALREAYGIDAVVGIGWWTIMLSSSTDGLIRRRAAAMLLPEVDPDHVAAMLVEVGLLEIEDGVGWRFHDWEDYRPSNARQVEAGRARAASAVRDKGRFTSQHQQAGTSHTSLPSRPSRPSRSSSSKGSTHSSRGRATDGREDPWKEWENGRP